MDHLRVASYKDRDDPGGQRHFREWSSTADCTTEFLWSLLLQHLPKKVKATPPENQVLVLGDHSVADRHLRVIQKGPKFATEPYISPPERLACVRNIARQVQEDLRPRFISEAMDVVSSTASGSRKPPSILPVMNYMLDNGLFVLESDKEGFLVVLDQGTYNEKAQAAVGKKLFMPLGKSRED